MSRNHQASPPQSEQLAGRGVTQPQHLKALKTLVQHQTSKGTHSFPPPTSLLFFLVRIKNIYQASTQTASWRNHSRSAVFWQCPAWNQLPSKKENQKQYSTTTCPEKAQNGSMHWRFTGAVGFFRYAFHKPALVVLCCKNSCYLL